jgi:hypothetical protein
VRYRSGRGGYKDSLKAALHHHYPFYTFTPSTTLEQLQSHPTPRNSSPTVAQIEHLRVMQGSYEAFFAYTTFLFTFTSLLIARFVR